MKKVLLASTAIVALAAAPAFAQEKPMSVELGGQGEFVFGLWDDQQDNSSSREAAFDLDLSLVARATSSNGLTYGIDIDLEAGDTDTAGNGSENGATFDEAHLFVSGDFGTFEAGDEDGAGDALQVFAPSNFGTGGIDGDFRDWCGDCNRGFSKVRTDSGDSTKLTYLTPTFEGVRGGISYAPETTGAGNEGDNINTTVTGGSPRDFVELGLNLDRDFGGIGVEASAVAMWFDVPATAASRAAVTGNNPNNLTEDEGQHIVGAFGAAVSMAGAKFGIAYITADEVAEHSGAINAGVEYETGPLLVGINGSRAIVQSASDRNGDGDTNDFGESEAEDDMVWTIAGGVNYTIATGLGVFTEVIYHHNGAGTARDQASDGHTDALIWLSGINVGF